MLIKRDATSAKSNSPACTVFEYLFHKSNLGIATSHINGRYPEAPKKAVNQKSDMIYFVIGGSGTIHTQNGSFSLSQGDAYFIDHGTWYWVEGDNLEIAIISNPDWYPEQYKEI